MAEKLSVAEVGMPMPMLMPATNEMGETGHKRMKIKEKGLAYNESTPSICLWSL